ncbi:sugar transferase [Pelagibacterium flavum]|uniref:Sugar transferase n=1 Tax=Pelagibacterium flavum TaxID=2984530 RepID=A0ABY6IPS1_9HYPH|nr:sugar transferase [Pelagibacterium sp. YIM 151497]UYQ72601.1 sugar transferase [Pelagibacterium sp. YIM 151497]
MKRLFDIATATVLSVLLLPVFIVLCVLVRTKLGSPIVFRQVRPGLHGRPFTLIKFRTMTDARNGDGELLSDAQRLTPFGRFLRSTSLDELPELWNVLRGEMSFVGPRPLLLEYLPLYSPRQARRHEVRPGITGWAQVNGRNALAWEDRLELDVWYVENRSMILDLKILFLTVGRVISRKGVTAEGSATVEKFKG